MSEAAPHTEIPSILAKISDRFEPSKNTSTVDMPANDVQNWLSG